MTWAPVASIDYLKARAELIRKIRHFFEEKNVLEVETPLLSHATVTDIHLHSLRARTHLYSQDLYLQTSPEYAMKRLLAAGSGPIFQICKSFRDDEVGGYHNTEFTMLEWYQPGYNHQSLMQEMEDLLQYLLDCPAAEKISYQDAFLKYAKVDPHNASISELQKALRSSDFNSMTEIDYNDRDILLQLIMMSQVEPNLSKDKPVFIYDYPASQAALAKLRKEPDGIVLAERFEVYLKGVELANGFHELTDAKEQRARFELDLEKREQANYPLVPIDENFLAALTHGLPACAGVALGVDRLVMIALRAKHIEEVMSFAIENA